MNSNITEATSEDWENFWYNDITNNTEKRKFYPHDYRIECWIADAFQFLQMHDSKLSDIWVNLLFDEDGLMHRHMVTEECLNTILKVVRENKADICPL